jgi:hypothetical protein
METRISDWLHLGGNNRNSMLEESKSATNLRGSRVEKKEI